MPPISQPHLTDGRIVVRPVSETDLDAVTEACQDPQIQAWTVVPSPYTRESAEEFLAMSRAGLADGSGAHMVVVGADDDRLLGACGLSVSRLDLAGEVGYWTTPQARGTGVARSAARLVCAWAFDELGLGRISLRAAVGNTGSNAVARSLGFVHEGTLRLASIKGHSGDPSDPRIDMNVYGLLPGELR